MDQHAAKTAEHADDERIIAALLRLPLRARAADAPAGGYDHAELHQDERAQSQIAGFHHRFEIVVVDIEVLDVVEHFVLHGDRAAEHAVPHTGPDAVCFQ